MSYQKVTKDMVRDNLHVLAASKLPVYNGFAIVGDEPGMEGNIIFNRNDGLFYGHTGATWEPFNSGGAGESNTGANVGVGPGQIFRDKTGVTLNLRTLTSTTGGGAEGSGGLNIVTTGNVVNLEVNGAATGATLQTAYDAFTGVPGTNPHITLSTADGELLIRGDAVDAVAPLFELQRGSDNATAFSVDPNGNVVIGEAANIVGGAGASASANVTAFTMGDTASTSGSNNFAFGDGATVSPGIQDCIALGRGTLASANSDVAIGNLAKCIGINKGNVALGESSGTGSTIGPINTAYSVAIGAAAKAESNSSVSIGPGTTCSQTGSGNIAIGSAAAASSTLAAGSYNIAMGSTATVNNGASDGIAMGRGTTVSSADGIAIGRGALVPGTVPDTICIGRQAGVTTAGATSVILGAAANGADESVTVGHGANASGEGGVSLGFSTVADTDSIAIGDSAQANALRSITIGGNSASGAIVVANDSIAIGDSTAIGLGSTFSTVIGSQSTIGTGGNAGVTCINIGIQSNVADAAIITSGINIGSGNTLNASNSVLIAPNGAAVANNLTGAGTLVIAPEAFTNPINATDSIVIGNDNADSAQMEGDNLIIIGQENNVLSTNNTDITIIGHENTVQSGVDGQAQRIQLYGNDISVTGEDPSLRDVAVLKATNGNFTVGNSSRNSVSNPSNFQNSRAVIVAQNGMTLAQDGDGEPFFAGTTPNSSGNETTVVLAYADATTSGVSPFQIDGTANGGLPDGTICLITADAMGRINTVTNPANNNSMAMSRAMNSYVWDASTSQWRAMTTTPQIFGASGSDFTSFQVRLAGNGTDTILVGTTYSLPALTPPLDIILNIRWSLVSNP